MGSARAPDPERIHPTQSGNQDRRNRDIPALNCLQTGPTSRLRHIRSAECLTNRGALQGVNVLETGCGAGRFTEILLQRRAAHVTSTDLSSAVDANLANCPHSDRHRIIQCDIYKLPFPPASYDVVICLGVIQHTPNPEATIAKLYAQVKPGGALVFDHYTLSLLVHN